MTNLVLPSRRSFLTGIGAVLITAPAIVRMASIMPIKSVLPEISMRMLTDYMVGQTTIELTQLDILYGTLIVRCGWLNNKIVSTVVHPYDIEVNRA